MTPLDARLLRRAHVLLAGDARVEYVRVKWADALQLTTDQLATVQPGALFSAPGVRRYLDDDGRGLWARAVDCGQAVAAVAELTRDGCHWEHPDNGLRLTGVVPISTVFGR